MNREEWLEKAIPRLNTILESRAELTPVKVKVSVGWPAHGALAPKKRRIGECWHSEIINQDTAHIFVSPFIDSPIDVLGVLLHEMIHAILPHKAAHKGAFAKVCKLVGFEGKPTSTEVSKEIGDPLRIELEQILEYLGEYPHHKIEPQLKDKKQTTRLRLYQCQCEEPTKLRVAKDDLDVTCNVCETKFERIEK